MNQLKTTFFTQLYFPDITTTAIIMNDLAEDLVFYGMDISVVCAQPTYLLKRKCPVSEVINGVRLNRVRTFLFDKNKILGRIFNSASCFISMLFKVIFSSKNDLSVFNTNPALLPFLGLVGLGFKGQKYVVLIHDLWPELPAHTGLIKKNGLLYKLIDLLNSLSLKYASGIVVLSDSMREVVLQKLPGNDHKIHVIHNWADNTRIYPVTKEKNKLLDDFRLHGKKVVMYSGNLGRYQPLEVMIHAAGHLQNRNDIIFLFVGDGAKKKKLQKMVKNKGLENVKFFPFQPMGRLAESLSIADVSLMGIMPENEGVIMPSKLYGLLSVGKPIVCVSHQKSEVVSILKMAEAGIHASIYDPENLASIIKSIIDEPLQAQKMGENGREYFLKHFERKIITMQWKEVLESISRREEDKKRKNPELEIIKIPIAEVSPN